MDPLRVPILLYHRISDDFAEGQAQYAVTPSAFERQLTCLREIGYESVSLGEVVAGLKTGAVLPRKAVAITFDDGYRDNFTHAYPLLRQHGFGATVFLVAGLVGKSAAWTSRLSEAAPPMLSWEEIEEMSRGGVSFEAHTCSHVHLTAVPLEEARREIVESRRIIEDRLQRPVNFFAYPFGEVDEGIQALLMEAGFAAAFAARWVRWSPQFNLYRLRRKQVNREDTLVTFKWRVEENLPALVRRRLERKYLSLMRRA